jgi:hypothetical protein
MLAKVKETLTKATEAVTDLVKKRGSTGAGSAKAMENKEADTTPSDNAQKMKSAVEAARNAKDED